ncbi:hypothetical protein D3C86_1613260 [compost metagenome]
MCWSAIAAVSLRRGSTTTSLPPRALIALRRFSTSGTVMMLPLEASGLPPRISMKSVWSISGMGISRPWPYIRWLVR